jgi:Fungal Zn(2)-Cys(6) binuclear cluster domain/Fungal specific transcription factor domain
MSSSLPIKRACDACHRRKVKCTGGLPCRNCTQATLSCTYNAIPQKKGPKGSRAKVISELRETQRQCEAANLQQRLSDPMGFDSPPMSPNFMRTPGVLIQETIDGCIDFFFMHMHPTMPILDRGRLQQQVQEIERSSEAYCLISSLCAFMMIQPGLPGSLRASGDGNFIGNTVSGKALLEESLRVRKSYNYIETPSTNTVIISFFLFACYFGLDKHNTAWFYLREATTLAEILGMQQEGSYISGDPSENARKRRLFWQLFVTERYSTLFDTGNQDIVLTIPQSVRPAKTSTFDSPRYN